MVKNSGSDERIGTVTLPQMNHDLYIVMNELNKLLKMKTKRVMKNQIKNLSEYGLTEIKMKDFNGLTENDFMYLDLMNMNKKLRDLIGYLDVSDLGEIIRMRRVSKSWILSTSYWFLSKEEVNYRKLKNEKVLEIVKIIDNYLKDNYSNQVNDFIEYEGEIINKSDVLVLVWEDEDCRDGGVNYEMDGRDFESTDFQSLIDGIKKYYDDEIGSNGGSIEIEIKGKPILHISSDSKNKWEVI
jgi:hypothetical protein